VLNLGGVGNVTLVEGDRLLASDTGPANGPLDSWLGGMDEGGRISRAGLPDFERLERWLGQGFFTKPVPRSADRYDFDVLGEMDGLSREDGAATLTAFTALSVARTLAQIGAKPDRVLVCGGGRHNRTLMTLIAMELDCPVWPAERVGWDSDAIEAQAFAYMAVRVLRGLPNSFPTTTGVPEPTVGGVIAHP
ncbi:MAG: anhydro-N-acetylmuramic acid kinase, partial [Litorimonas sp.]